ncbi:MAG: 30S ribosomal protein S2 [Candidatus Babeliales bacterium]
MIDFKELIKAGVHFGHQSSRWSPKMDPYIWGHRRGVHLIDVSKTANQLEKAAQFLQELAKQGKSILWIGTKKPAQAIISKTGLALGMPYVNHRWIGGTLTNFSQVKKSVTNLLHFDDVIKKADQFSYTKKELNTISKTAERLRKNVGGIVNLRLPIGAIVVVDVRKELAAIREAIVSGVPVVALVDTNSDPSLVDYVIPANDDSPKSIGLILQYLEDATAKGKAAAKKVAPKTEAKAVEVAKAGIEVVEVVEEEEEESTPKKTESKKVSAKSPGASK